MSEGLVFAEFPQPKPNSGSVVEGAASREVPITPKVTLDAAYQDHLPDFTVDAEAIADHLRDGGLSDQDIAETSIHFHANSLTRHGNAIYGELERRRKKSIAMYPSTSLAEIARWGKAHGYNGFLSHTNEILAHELEHRRMHFNPEMKRQKARQSIREVARVFGAFGAVGVLSHATSEMLMAAGVEQDTSSAIGYATLALSGLAYVGNRLYGPGARRAYLRNPEEQHCFAFQETKGLPRFVDMPNTPSPRPVYKPDW